LAQALVVDAFAEGHRSMHGILRRIVLRDSSMKAALQTLDQEILHRCAVEGRRLGEAGRRMMEVP
jgi:hypothetical protein